MSLRQKFAASATGFLALTTIAALPSEAFASNGEQRQQAINIAHKAIDCVFPAESKNDAFLASSYKKLTHLVEQLPNATTDAERQAISTQAYNIHQDLDKRHYKLYFGYAAHSVAMAAQIATKASFNGPWDVTSGNKESLSLDLTQKAVEYTDFWYKRSGPGKASCNIR